MSRLFTAASSEKLLLADNTKVSMGDVDFTIHAWVRATTLSGNPMLLAKWDETLSKEYQLFSSSAFSQQFRLVVMGVDNVTSASVVASSVTPTTAVWYSVVADHDATGNVVGLCVNGGTRHTTAHTAGVRDSTQDLLFGARRNNTTIELFWDGRIAEVAIWKGIVLNASERTSLANGVRPGRIRPAELASGGYWPIWGDHSPEIDLTQNVNSLTVTGTAKANHAPVMPFSRRWWGMLPEDIAEGQPYAKRWGGVPFSGAGAKGRF